MNYAQYFMSQELEVKNVTRCYLKTEQNIYNK